MCAKQPRLLSLRASRVEARVEALQQALGLTPLQARRLIVQEPLWLIASLRWLQQQLEQLAAVYGAPNAQLLQMLQQCPQMLLTSPDAQRAKIQQVAAALGVEPAAVAAAYQRSPALLSWRAGTLVAKVQQLQGAMGLGAAQVLAAAAASSLLFKRTEAVGLRWAQLQRCAQRCPRWAQEWQDYTWSTRACLLLKGARFHARCARALPARAPAACAPGARSLGGSPPPGPRSAAGGAGAAPPAFDLDPPAPTSQAAVPAGERPGRRHQPELRHDQQRARVWRAARWLRGVGGWRRPRRPRRRAAPGQGGAAERRRPGQPGRHHPDQQL
jgi:hypothetical protein